MRFECVEVRLDPVNEIGLLLTCVDTIIACPAAAEHADELKRVRDKLVQARAQGDVDDL